MDAVKGVAVVLDYVEPIAIFAEMEVAKNAVFYWAVHDEKGSTVSLVDLATGEYFDFIDGDFTEARPFDPDLLGFLRTLAAKTFDL